MNSMTAYGQANSREVEGISWQVEIHSVNRRHFDLSLSLPSHLLSLDVPIRKALAKEIGRGSVSVKISLQKGGHKQGLSGRLKELKDTWVDMAYELGYGPEEINLPFLLSRFDTESCSPSPLSKEQEEALMLTLDKALAQFLKMRSKEGKELALDLKNRLKEVGLHLKEIEKKGATLASAYRDKLLERLKEIGALTTVDERVLKEVALFAEKCDCTEEIVRLTSHLKQFDGQLKEKGPGVGKALDFLCQEMLREANTIGSKAQELEIIKTILLIKAGLEKIREQVQNIE